MDCRLLPNEGVICFGSIGMIGVMSSLPLCQLYCLKQSHYSYCSYILQWIPCFPSSMKFDAHALSRSRNCWEWMHCPEYWIDVPLTGDDICCSIFDIDALHKLNMQLYMLWIFALDPLESWCLLFLSLEQSLLFSSTLIELNDLSSCIDRNKTRTDVSLPKSC